MSEENRLQTEEELWDVLSAPVVPESASKPAPKPKPAPRPKTEGRFARPDPVPEKPAPVKAVAVPEKAQKEGSRFDGFFFACMAAVAAVSVALTLVVSSMAGGDRASAPAGETLPIVTADPAAGDTGLLEQLLEEQNTANAVLQQENDQLREQVQLQTQQLNDLQARIQELTGSPAELPTTGSSDSTATQSSEQAQAQEIFQQIRDAYADFDRARLEELIPQMDKLVRHLSSDALNEYYLILEYVEQPSNG